ncbi:MAG: hypothetical protein JNK67_04605 [Alphaproteobacteria bacterium]|nr:hypothetical protein [Alphaproteobacteria bacterium]
MRACRTFGHASSTACSFAPRCCRPASAAAAWRRVGRDSAGRISGAIHLRSIIHTILGYKLWAEVRLQSLRPVSAKRRNHLLVVSWAFPPMHATSAHFPKALACAAGGMGQALSVVCAPVPDEPTAQGNEMLEDLPPGIRILRVPGRLRAGYNPTLYPATRLFPQIDGEFATALLMSRHAMASLRDDPPSMILAFGPRFANFVAGYQLSRGLGAPLALFYIDEWTVMTPSFVTVGPDDRAWEDRCLRHARFVAFVTEGKRRDYCRAFPFIEPRAHVYENGWDPRPFAKAAMPSRGADDGILTIDFVGVAATHTPIREFFETLAPAFERAPELRTRVAIRMTGPLTEYGQSCAAWAREHGISVAVHPGVPQSEAVGLMMSSDACLLLLNTAYDGLIPQKTYDYMRAGAPILAFGTSSEGARVVNATGAGPAAVAVGDAAALAGSLRRLIEAPRERWRTAERAEWVASRNRETIAGELIRDLHHAS